MNDEALSMFFQLEGRDGDFLFFTYFLLFFIFYFRFQCEDICTAFGHSTSTKFTGIAESLVSNSSKIKNMNVCFSAKLLFFFYFFFED
jgi:hypothetical protein